MKKASIVSVGNEILAGQIIDTNVAYLSEKLLSIGIPTVSCYTIGDEIEVIVRALLQGADDADIVLVTGGLGPTDDDLTRQGLAKFLRAELQLQDGLLSKIESFFAERNVRMPEKNKVEAYIPAGARALDNRLGTASGIIAEHKSKLFVAMPGVPSEMKRMFEDSVFSELGKLASGQVVVVRKLKCFGTGESSIAQMLGDLMSRSRNPLINCTVKCGVITLHIVATAKDRAEAQEMIAKDEKLLRDILGQLVYGTDEQTLAEVVGQELARQNKTVAVAESCTGGLIGKLITDIAGASGYFSRGWIAYSNLAKVEELGVSADLLEKYGAVSEQVASAMAKSARRKAKSDFAIGVTGIAGPTGGSVEKPVGLVYIAVDSEAGCQAERFVFSHNREFIRLRAAQAALDMLRLRM